MPRSAVIMAEIIIAAVGVGFLAYMTWRSRRPKNDIRDYVAQQRKKGRL